MKEAAVDKPVGFGIVVALLPEVTEGGFEVGTTGIPLLDNALEVDCNDEELLKGFFSADLDVIWTRGVSEATGCLSTKPSSTGTANVGAATAAARSRIDVVFIFD